MPPRPSTHVPPPAPPPPPAPTPSNLISSHRNDLRTMGSSAPNGSSSSMRRGLQASARATATRCRCPPDSCGGKRPPNPGRSVSSSSSFTLRVGWDGVGAGSTRVDRREHRPAAAAAAAAAGRWRQRRQHQRRRHQHQRQHRQSSGGGIGRDYDAHLACMSISILRMRGPKVMLSATVMCLNRA